MVNRQDDQTIKLEMVIDRPELERQLGTIFQGPAGKGVPIAGGGGGAQVGGVQVGRRPGEPTKATVVKPDQSMGRQLQHLTRLAGIYFGVSAMVKNSKVLGTTMSALGSIMGAILDSFLVPFLPLIVRLLKALTPGIQKAREVGGAVASGLEDIGLGLGLGDAAPGERARARRNIGKFAMDPLLGISNAIGMDRPSMIERQAVAGVGGAAIGGAVAGPPGAAIGFLAGLWAPVVKAMIAPDLPDKTMGISGTPRLLEIWSKMSDAKLQQFLELTKSRSLEFNISVQGITMDQIMDNLRREIDIKLTEAGHASGLGKP